MYNYVAGRLLFCFFVYYTFDTWLSSFINKSGIADLSVGLAMQVDQLIMYYTPKRYLHFLNLPGIQTVQKPGRNHFQQKSC